MSLQKALDRLEAEFTAFAPGSQSAPKEGTTDWYVLRTRALGLSFLRQLRARGLEGDTAAVERLYRNSLKDAKEDLRAP